MTSQLISHYKCSKSVTIKVPLWEILISELTEERQQFSFLWVPLLVLNKMYPGPPLRSQFLFSFKIHYSLILLLATSLDRHLMANPLYNTRDIYLSWKNSWHPQNKIIHSKAQIENVWWTKWQEPVLGDWMKSFFPKWTMSSSRNAATFLGYVWRKDSAHRRCTS